MKLIFYSILLFFITSCLTSNKQWQTFDHESFKIKTPPGWTKFKLQEVNNYTGGFTNGKDTLFFDYGKYREEIDGYESSKYLYGQDTINGYIAIIQIPKVDGSGFIRLSFPRVDQDNKFSITGNNIKGTEKILQIFKSVVFKTSDPAINSNLTLEKFKPYSFANGRIFFISTCAACHHKSRLLVGPPLTLELLNARTNDWFYTFFKDRKNLIEDSAYLARAKIYRANKCIELPEYSKENIDQVISYLKGR